MIPIVLGWLLAVGASPASAAPLSPDEAVVAALNLHPDVQLADAERLAAEGARTQSSVFLYNPTVMGRISVDGRRGMAMLSQPLSISGEGWHARAEARNEVEAASANLTRAQLIAAADVRRAYVRAAVASAQVRVAQQGVELSSRLRRGVDRQGEEGEISALSVSLGRMAEVQTATRMMAAQEVEADALQELAALIGRDVRAEDLVLDILALAPSPGEAPQERSDVIAARRHLEAAKANHRRRKAAGMPAVSIGAFISAEDGELFAGPTLGLTLPIWQQGQVNTFEAKGQAAIAEAHLKALEARAAAEVRTAGERLAQSEALQAALIADPVDEARRALASIESGYIAGEIDLASTVLLQDEVQRGESAALELLGQVAYARLDFLLATDDPALLGGAQ